MKNMAPAWALTLPGLAVRAQRPGHRQLRGLQSLGVLGVHAPSLPIAFVSALAIGPAGAGHAKPGDSRHLLRFGQA
jgi:hypothetical protein